MSAILRVFFFLFLALNWIGQGAYGAKSSKVKKSAHKHSSPEAPVERVLAKYRSGKAVQARVKKVVKQELMGTSTTSEGRFYFAKGRLRMDMEKPEKSILVYDGKNIWLEARLDDSHIQVSHLKSGELKKSDSILAALFDRKDVLKKFKLLSVTERTGQTVYAFEPKVKKETEIQSLEVALKDQDISRVTYKDQMENQVDFEFAEVSRQPVHTEKFKYTPPKGASVTEL